MAATSFGITRNAAFIQEEAKKGENGPGGCSVTGI
jgi:hypothetical protein